MTAERLQHLVNTIPAMLLSIDETEFIQRPAPGKWSKKEIIGHLIDSATNNHHRFIRTQYEDVPTIFYDQNKWNTLNNYNAIDGKQVIELWAAYNRHLVAVIKHIPQENLQRECQTGDGKRAKLDWIIDDYVAHMEHHLKQVLNY